LNTISLPDPLNFVYRNLHLGQAKLIVSFSSLSVLILSGLLYAAVDGRGFGKNWLVKLRLNYQVWQKSFFAKYDLHST